MAIKVAFSLLEIKELVTLNGTVVLPAIGWTRAGTLICVLLDESRIPGLLAGAAPESVIWHALVPPPMRVCGLHVTVVTDTLAPAGPNSVSVCDRPWLGALIVTGVVDDTAAAVAVKVALVKPALIVIEDGMVTRELEELSEIRVLDCAGLPRLKVHVLEPGVWILVGEQTRLGPVEDGVIVRVDVRVAAPAVAVMVALPEAVAATAAVKAADDAPD